MRAIAGSIVTLAGAVLSLTPRGDFVFGYGLILIGLAILAYGIAKPGH